MITKDADVPVRVIANLLCDMHMLHGEVYTPLALQTSLDTVERYSTAGSIVLFLTKELPRIGKSFDLLLAGSSDRLIRTDFPFLSEVPILSELLDKLTDDSGKVLPSPCADYVRSVRALCYVLYKYKLPYSSDQTQSVIDKFLLTEREVGVQNIRLAMMLDELERRPDWTSNHIGVYQTCVLRRARTFLSKVLGKFDPYDIIPAHGPGVVSTKEKLWNKYVFRNVPDRVLAHFPLDQYFYTNLGHVSNELPKFLATTSIESPAQVILVPKDSRGPRLISAEPLYLQWIQQGVSRALVRHVERHPLTKGRVNFTDQEPNRQAALQGSIDNSLSTLDLAEASDRISLGLIRLIFPEPLLGVLEAVRSQSTRLPDGTVVPLGKHAPMGSALCFPVLALTCYALLWASAPDKDAQKSILVYGDDVIVKRDFSQHAIEQLTYYGLEINRSKSCISGSFKESCGMDAFLGVNVTPVRLKTVWSSTPSPSIYSSYIEFCNSCWDRRLFHVYDYIVGLLKDIYPIVPGSDLDVPGLRLRGQTVSRQQIKKRRNFHLQKMEYRLLEVCSRPVRKETNDYRPLLRYFTEAVRDRNDYAQRARQHNHAGAVTLGDSIAESSFTASQYTERNSSYLGWRWR
jgi:hypothetical protein